MYKKNFDNLSFLETKPIKQTKISILPIPLDMGSHNTGMDAGPDYLKKLGLVAALHTAGFEIKLLPKIDYKKLKSSSRKDSNQRPENNLEIISELLAKANETTAREILNGGKILSIGGDHSISMGTVSGAARTLEGDLGLIWIDAHADVNTLETSLSGHVHGMSTAALIGLGSQKLNSLAGSRTASGAGMGAKTTAPIKKENILYIGLKDLDNAEIDLIRKHKLATITMMEIIESGFSKVYKQIKTLANRTAGIWISLDLDSIDQQYAPAASLASPGGLTYREIINLLTFISGTTNVIGFEIVELAPKKDVANKTGHLAIELAAAAFGSIHNWYSKYMQRQSEMKKKI